jgi:hypothetical protein
MQQYKLKFQASDAAYNPLAAVMRQNKAPEQRQMD